MDNPVEFEVRDRLESIRRRLRAACERAKRNPEDIVLLGIGKRQPLERVSAVIAAGLKVLGENQVQEAAAKSAQLPVDVDWHLVGHLQSNKVKAAVRLFSTIHSIDRLKIARKISIEAERQGRVIDGFVQVNLGDEPSKHGYAPQELPEAMLALAEHRHLRIVGLMAIPPYEKDPQAARRWFGKLRQLRNDIFASWTDSPGWLSMGMSHDFEIAIEEGATHIRVGTAIFGERPS